MGKIRDFSEMSLGLHWLVNKSIFVEEVVHLALNDFVLYVERRF